MCRLESMATVPVPSRRDVVNPARPGREQRSQRLRAPGCDGYGHLHRAALDPSAPERCPSGRRSTPGKCVWVKAHRGFESLPLRHYRLQNSVLRESYPNSYRESERHGSESPRHQLRHLGPKPTVRITAPIIEMPATLAARSLHETAQFHTNTFRRRPVRDHPSARFPGSRVRASATDEPTESRGRLERALRDGLFADIVRAYVHRNGVLRVIDLTAMDAYRRLIDRNRIASERIEILHCFDSMAAGESALTSFGRLFRYLTLSDDQLIDLVSNIRPKSSAPADSTAPQNRPTTRSRHGIRNTRRCSVVAIPKPNRGNSLSLEVQLTQEIQLADRHTLCSQNAVSRGGMEIKAR